MLVVALWGVVDSAGAMMHNCFCYSDTSVVQMDYWLVTYLSRLVSTIVPHRAVDIVPMDANVEIDLYVVEVCHVMFGHHFVVSVFNSLLLFSLSNKDGPIYPCY